jgi:hypothetical protein
VATWPLGASAAGSLAPSSLVRGMVKPSRSWASRAKWQARQGERQQAHSRSSALEPCRQMDEGVCEGGCQACGQGVQQRLAVMRSHKGLHASKHV